MEFITTDLTKKTTGYMPGMCKIFLIPVELLPEVATNLSGEFEWPEDYPIESFPENKIITIDLVKDSYKCRETPKKSDSGNFYEIKISIESNNLDAQSRQTLISLSLRPVQVLIFSNDHKGKLYGQSDRGLDLVYETGSENGSTNQEKIIIDISGQSVDPAPFTTLTL